MSAHSLWIAFLLVCFLGGSRVNASAERMPQPAGSPLPIILQADNVDYRQVPGIFRAHGQVVVQRGETRLSADQLAWQTQTQDALAEGSVSLHSPQGWMTANRLRYNLATQQGQLEAGRVYLNQGNFHLTGAEIEQFAPASYRIKSGLFTTCDGWLPDWSFSAAQVEVTVGKYATARHAWFRVRNTPVFYFPYLVFPVKTERESGFLTPGISQSRKQGTRLSLAWYQVIDRHMDATLQIDNMSKLGLGKGLEYRYLLGTDQRGEANLYHVSGRSGQPNLHALGWEHAGSLPGGIWLAVDGQYVEERLFFENFGHVAGEYNQDKTVSQIWAQRNWRQLNGVVRGRYIEDVEDPAAAPLQRLPELTISQAPHRLGALPLFFGVDASLTHFEREQGETGQRLFLRPSLTSVVDLGPWLNLVPELAVSQRFYATGQGQADKTLLELAARLGSRLEKIYAPQNRPDLRLKHSIEPEIRYLYVPDQSEAQLPFFDNKDRRADLNRLEYALTNRVTLRQSASDGSRSYRELVSVRLSQSYDIAEERDRTLEKPQPFSDLRLELDWRPTSSSRVYFDGLINMYRGSAVSRLLAGANLQDAQGNGLNLDYVYRDDQSDLSGTEYLGVSLRSSLLAPLFVRFEERYNLRAQRELEKVVGVEYRGRCWSLFLEYRDRLADERVTFGVELSGLGRVGGGS